MRIQTNTYKKYYRLKKKKKKNSCALLCPSSHLSHDPQKKLTSILLALLLTFTAVFLNDTHTVLLLNLVALDAAY